jgi:polysaccharide export outer membrane protein
MVRVTAFDEELAAPFNSGMMGFVGGGQGQNGQNGQIQQQMGMQGIGGNGNNPMQNMMGVLVDNLGNVELPVVGTVHLGGMTLENAKVKLYGIYGNYLTNYAADIMFLNKRVTLTGEVAMPGVVTMDRNRMSVLEIIQKGGGITAFSNTENVTVIREINGERKFAILNLKDRGVVNSPFFYVYPNDIVYLQPIKAKTFTAQTSFLTGLNILTTLVSAAALFFAFTR